MSKTETTTKAKQTKSPQSSSNTNTNKKKPNPAPTAPYWDAEKKRFLRLSIGFTVILFGVFLCAAILGYCISWKEDQNHIITSGSIWAFLFKDDTAVSNFCGRLGAVTSHLLVYRSMGLMALSLTIWISTIGVNLIYGYRKIRSDKWGKYIAFCLLFMSPFLAYLFQNSEFPIGGAIGNSVIDWTKGFAGKVGTIIFLTLEFCIFAFIVFNLDIKPYIDEIREITKQRKGQALKINEIELAEQKINERFDQIKQEEDDELEEIRQEVAQLKNQNGPAPITDSGNRLRDDVVNNQPLTIKYDANDDNVNLDIVEFSFETPMSPSANNTIIKNEDQIAGISLEIPENNISSLENVFPEIDLSMNEVEDKSVEMPFEIHIPEETVEDEPVEDTVNPLPNMNETLSANTIQLDLPPNTSKTVPPSKSAVDIADDELEVTIKEEEEMIPAHKSHISIESNEPYDPSLDLSSYKYPTLDLLAAPTNINISFDREELEQNKQQIISTLKSFGIEIQKISATVGPTVTLYEIIPAEGVRISRIKNLEDDIALSLAALGIRIIAPIPGRGTIGIEVPNKNKQTVFMRTLLSSEKFINSTASLPIALGKKIDNENYIVDLATMPHLLMAGATGQGKSVGINAILVSLLYKKHPSQLKFVMVDPKKVELSIYRHIERHFLAKLPNEEEAIITDTKKVINTLNALCIEMDERYDLLKIAGARNIKEYNDKFINRKLNPNNGHKYLPFIVLVIDEFADLIMTAGKEIEAPIARLAQLARAIGIHLIVATQRPSVNVITGMIKANFPARLAFRVSSKIDSRTILDQGGADQLIGRGDMLINTGNETTRIQCAFVDTPEVERIVEFIGDQRGYPTAFELPEYESDDDAGEKMGNVDLSKRDKLFEEAAKMVVNSQSGSTSMLQRKFNLGYNRAGRIMDQLEAAGIVGETRGSKPRDVLVQTEFDLDKILETL